MKIELSGHDELELEHLLGAIGIEYHHSIPQVGYIKPRDPDYTPLVLVCTRALTGTEIISIFACAIDIPGVPEKLCQ